MSTAEIVLIIIGAVNVLLLIILLLRKQKPEESNQVLNRLEVLNRQMGDEFQRSRQDFTGFKSEFFSDKNKTSEEIAQKLSEVQKSNLEHHLEMTKTLTRSIAEMRDKNSELSEKQTLTMEISLGKLQESNEKKLEEMRSTVDEKLNATLATRLDSSFKTVSDQLENVYKSLGEMKELSSGVTDNVTSLNRVLTNVKTRGTWAEVQLEAILDQTIPGMYVKNYAPGVGAERVEFAIKIPSGDSSDKIIYLPLDSKFPMEDYIRLCDAADNADAELVAVARKSLENAVTKAAKDIGKYIKVPETTPFAIMYLATEGLYAEIASSKNGILETLQSKFNVMIAGPSTITALLNSLAMGFKTVAMNEKANEIRKLLGAAKTQYDKFGDILARARKKIEEAGKSLDDAQHRNSIIQKNLRNIEAMDSEDAQSFLGLDEENL